MNNDLFNLILSIIALIIAAGGGYLIKLFKQVIDTSKYSNYFNIAKQVVMSIEQLYPEFDGTLKKEKAVELLLSLTNNKLTNEQASTLIEAAVYEVKKLLQNNSN